MLRFYYMDDLICIQHNVDNYEKSIPFRPWKRKAMRIYYVIDGATDFVADGKHFSATGGDLLLFDYGESCRQFVFGSRPFRNFERIVVGIQPEIFDAFDPKRTLLRPLFQEIHHGRNLLKPEEYPDFHWDAALRKMVQPTSEPIGNIYSGLLDFLNDLNRVYTSAPTNTREDVDDQLIAQILEEIDSHPNELVSVETLQRDFHISPTCLYTRFRKVTGVSVHQYIASRRMETARSMLEAGIPALTVSTQCGYTDYSAFYRAFRRQFGFSPRSVSGQTDDGAV